MTFTFNYTHPLIGDYRISATDKGITRISFGHYEKTTQEIIETPLIKQLNKELISYFNGKNSHFTTPFILSGTPFQHKVWETICKIPYGETLSYKTLALLCGSPKGARAVASACHCNPLLFIIPCHRVIGSNGSLTGYAGGLPIKEKLLKMEKGE